MDRHPIGLISNRRVGMQPARKPINNSLQDGPSCSVCMDEFHVHELIRAPCNHTICKDCATRIFTMAMKDQTRFPAHCCSLPIPMAVAEDILDSELVRQYMEKAIEYNTADRVYCSNKYCSTFILPKTIVGTVATCPRCNTRTCASCKMGASHRSGHCPRDKEKETLLQAARAAKYQICYRCREMRELSSGCNHITCPCGAEFCYVCGGVWKHCDCPANGLNGGMPDLVPGVLLGDANQQGDQDLNAAAAPLHNQADAEQAAQAMDFEDMAAHAANPNEPILPEVDTQPRELTDAQYECHSVRRQNRHWDGVFGGSFCSFCQWISDFHIFRCRECGIQACRRCTYTAALLPVDER